MKLELLDDLLEVLQSAVKFDYIYDYVNPTSPTEHPDQVVSDKYAITRLFEGEGGTAELEQVNNMIPSGIGLPYDYSSGRDSLETFQDPIFTGSFDYGSRDRPLVYIGYDTDGKPWLKGFAVKYVLNVRLYDISDTLLGEIKFDMRSTGVVRDTTFDKMFELRVYGNWVNHIGDIELLCHQNEEGFRSHGFQNLRSISENNRKGSLNYKETSCEVPFKNGEIWNDTLITADFHMYCLGSFYKY